MKKRFLVLVAAGAAVLTFGACSTFGVNKITEPYKDAGIAHRNNSAADVLSMPDGFNNVAAKCDGPNRVYVIFHHNADYGAVAVAPNDPRCTR